MTDEPAERRRMYLAGQRLGLWALDVAEEAECVVRRCWEATLQESLRMAVQQLQAAGHQLALARVGDDLAAILAAEQTACDASRIVDALQRRHDAERRARLEAEDTYRAERDRQQMRVLAAQRAVARRDGA